MKILTFDDFLKYFELRYTPTFQSYKENLVIFRARNKNKLFDVYMLDKNDFRTERYDELLDAYYDIFITNRLETLEYWFDKHLKITDPNKYLQFGFKKDINNFNIIDGAYRSGHTRIVKNINFDSLYKTTKTNGLDSTEILPALKMMVEGPVIYYPFALPMGAIKVLEKNLDDMFAIMRGTTNRPSVFNPYTAAYIFQYIFKAKKIFTPVLDWGSYYIAFQNTTAEHYTGIDVMDSQIKLCYYLQEWYEDNSGMLDLAKKCHFMQQQSERLHYYPGFMTIHEKFFDTIFMSPPYYDLELYHEADKDHAQSTSSFQTYEKWLEGYWDKTLQNCKRLMTPDGKFGFVITEQYGIGDNKRQIGQDMKKIAKKYFKIVDIYQIEWSAITRVSAKKMQKGNFEYFYLMEHK